MALVLTETNGAPVFIRTRIPSDSDVELITLSLDSAQWAVQLWQPFWPGMKYSGTVCTVIARSRFVRVDRIEIAGVITGMEINKRDWI